MTCFTLAHILVFLALTTAPEVLATPIFVRRDLRDGGVLNRRSGTGWGSKEQSSWFGSPPNHADSGFSLKDPETWTTFSDYLHDVPKSLETMSVQLHENNVNLSDMNRAAAQAEKILSAINKDSLLHQKADSVNKRQAYGKYCAELQSMLSVTKSIERVVQQPDGIGKGMPTLEQKASEAVAQLDWLMKICEELEAEQKSG
ncbi:hypothetical protein F5878DRAFT_617885 [Lentinula raphanica]|uniref:Uncharacterized protein n=1 Tax=Lentinula raphanica TaxID=153919 RepID=A0AA38UEW5_9AGAR|nr:hypothetical protein F5878DRAFT_617885 [Lentinula raphanica]